MKQILVIHTGGTIAMQEDETTGAVQLSSNNPLQGALAQLEQHARLIVKEPFQKPSPHMTIDDMVELKELIEKECSKQQVDGVVITHGTDTLEETAYFLDLTVQIDVPVVITGAMRSSNEIGYDGLHNYFSAIKVASSEEAKGKGVLVVFNDEIHTAESVTKTHTSSVSTFQSPSCGPIGTITKRGVMLHHSPVKREHYRIQNGLKRVALLKAYASMDSDLLLAAKELRYDGVVIEALGQGNLPPGAMDGLKGLLEANIPVVLVSRCFSGIPQDVYGYDGGGKQLKELGVIFSNGLNGQKARIKLLIALAETNDLKKLNDMF